MKEWSAYLDARRARIEAALVDALRPEIGFPESLREAMTYSLLAPGKRLRPLLVIMAAEACGQSGAEPWAAGCAVEMIHAYSLIHDDLPAMDDDDMRRGQPTCHKKFGEALAILAGDALQGLAFQVLADSYPPYTAAACCGELARAAGAAGMVGGQVDDLAWEDLTRNGERQSVSEQPSVDVLEKLHARKTGALIRAALRLGVLTAHAPGAPDPALFERFDGYGQALGLAFQITDDLLDVEGHADRAGKRVGKDAERGKLTYPGLLGVAESRHRAERLCREATERLAPLGSAAAPLRALAAYVLDRDR